MAIIRVQLSIDIDTNNGQAVVVNPVQQSSPIPSWYELAAASGLVKPFDSGKCLWLCCPNTPARDFGLFCSAACAQQVIPQVKQERRALIAQEKRIERARR